MFIKKYYKSNIPINKISKEPILVSNQEIKKEDIISIINKFNKTKELMDNHLKEIKEKIKDCKDAETLNLHCENYISINNKIISIIEQLFNSYKILEDNKSNY